MNWYLVGNETVFRISEYDAFLIHNRYPESTVIREDKLPEYLETKRYELIYG